MALSEVPLYILLANSFTVLLLQYVGEQPSDGSKTWMSHIGQNSLVITTLIILLAVGFSAVIVTSMLVFNKNR